MAKTTFSGPVKSLAGFISAGNAAVVSLTADTTLTVAAHAGKTLLTNDADGKFTLPTIVATAPDSDDDPNQLNNLGASFTFVVVTPPAVDCKNVPIVAPAGRVPVPFFLFNFPVCVKLAKFAIFYFLKNFDLQLFHTT